MTGGINVRKLFWEDKLRRKLAGRRFQNESIGPGRLHLAYRISEAGYPKVKLPNINNENCLRNAVGAFPPQRVDWKIICDGCGKDTLAMIRNYLPEAAIQRVQVGHGAGTFNLALDWAVEKPDEDVVYFLENDYLHTPDALDVLLDGMSMGAEMVSLYDHPDKYDSSHPLYFYMGAHTRVFLGKTRHWKTAFSTTMTFAARVGCLRRHEHILRKWTSGRYPHDFEMFNELLCNGVRLLSPMPSASTHGEVAFLAPLVDWSRF